MKLVEILKEYEDDMYDRGEPSNAQSAHDDATGEMMHGRFNETHSFLQDELGLMADDIRGLVDTHGLQLSGREKQALEYWAANEDNLYFPNEAQEEISTIASETIETMEESSDSKIVLMAILEFLKIFPRYATTYDQWAESKAGQGEQSEFSAEYNTPRAEEAY